MQLFGFFTVKGENYFKPIPLTLSNNGLRKIAIGQNSMFIVFAIE